jgi:hypothetical protein
VVFHYSDGSHGFQIVGKTGYGLIGAAEAMKLQLIG